MLFFRILLPILLSVQNIPADLRNIPAGMPQRADSDTSRELKLRLLEIINRDRQAAGVRPVAFSEDLSKAADAHCREMLRENFTSHWNRAGWKPYMRYSVAGVRDSTEENIYSLSSTELDTSLAFVWRMVQDGHRGFLAERPPADGHRRSILSPRHTHVGIGLVFDKQGLRLIEVFGARYAQFDPLPQDATLRDTLTIRGRITDPNLKLFGVDVYYEPLPKPMMHIDLRATGSYGLPEEHQMERRWLWEGKYADNSKGSIDLDEFGKFSLPLHFWKKQPGVYTVGVWVIEKNGHEAFLGALSSIFVEEEKKSKR